MIGTALAIPSLGAFACPPGESRLRSSRPFASKAFSLWEPFARRMMNGWFSIQLRESEQKSSLIGSILNPSAFNGPM